MNPALKVRLTSTRMERLLLCLSVMRDIGQEQKLHLIWSLDFWWVLQLL